MKMQTFLTVLQGRSAVANPVCALGSALRCAWWISCTAALVIAMPPAAAGQEKSLKLVLIDAGAQQAMAHQGVMLWGDEGVRCIRAPCPMRVGILWRGTTNSRGVLVVPQRAVTRQSAVEVSGYVRQSFSGATLAAELRIPMTRISP
jgi:hypothetical protein